MSGKTLVLVVVLLAASVTQNDAAPKKKEPGMTYIGHFSGGNARSFQASDYYVSDNAATWTIANNNCKAIFGDTAGLVSLESEAEKNSLNTMLEDYGAGITYWTSGIYDPSAALWRWTPSNAPIGIWAPWGAGSPGSPTSVSRLAILYLNQFSANWISIFNTQKYPYICEVQSSPAPQPTVTYQCAGGASVVTSNLARLIPGTGLDHICRYEILKQSGVCQIRLDFGKFMIAEGPDVQYTGDCDADRFIISGHSNGQLGALCGNLGGQHMYLDYGTNNQINLDINMIASMGQTWDIGVTQIKCDSPEQAPPGCLQYFTEQSGTVKSFNFGHQLNNQDYTVCVKTNPSMSKIEWKSCGGDKDFGISGESQASGPGIGGESGDSCTRDWVLIYGSTRYCGTWFPNSVMTSVQPFMMNVHFDNVELDFPSDPNIPFVCGVQSCDSSNAGFCLIYTQSPN